MNAALELLLLTGMVLLATEGARTLSAAPGHTGTPDGHHGLSGLTVSVVLTPVAAAVVAVLALLAVPPALGCPDRELEGPTPRRHHQLVWAWSTRTWAAASGSWLEPGRTSAVQ